MIKVLIVEDELSIANFLIDLVQILGYEYKHLTSGRKVLSLAQEWKPNLITLDLAMPSPDGVACLEALKNDPETRSIPVFIVSALVKQPGMQEKIKQAMHVFEKPLNAKDFIEKVRTVCEGEASA